MEAAEKPYEVQLLEKLPEFDPKWSDAMKLKWFDWFDKLLKMKNGESETSQKRAACTK